MSYKDRSLSNNNINDFDAINLRQWTGALTIGGASGGAGQVLKKNATTNKIEWGEDTPGSLSASSPIVLVGTNLSLGTNFGGQAITTTGTITGGTIAATGNLTAGGVSVCKAAAAPLALSTGNMTLNFNTNDFEVSGVNLQLKNDPVITATAPLSISTGNISLTLDSSKLEVSSDELTLKETYFKTATNPLSSAGSSVGLNFNTGDFQLDGSNHLALKNDPVITASAPLSVSTGNMSLSFLADDFYLSSNSLAISKEHQGKTLYYSATDDKYYLLLLPQDFMNDNDSSGYNRTVIADSGMGGALQCYAGTQYFAFFDIPHGYNFSGFRVNLTNSAGTPQGTTAGVSTFYCAFSHKTITTNLVFPNRSGASNIFAGYNTHNAYTLLGSGYDSSTMTKSNIGNVKFGSIMCYRLNWSSAYYNLGGYVEFAKSIPPPPPP